jgi:DNA modification methylase
VAADPAEMTKRIEALTDLQPDQGNANKGTERGQYMLDESIAQVGAARSIVTDRDGVVIAGNKTLQAAVDAGLGVQVVQTDGNDLVVVQRTDLDLDGEGDEAERARLAAYFDNRSSEVGLAWDAEQIAADIAAGMDFGPMFGDDELADILGDLAPEPQPDPGAQIDKAAELQAKWDTALGQIWEIGQHRIVCGDCTDAAVVEALMQGERAALGVTSPPYAVGKEYEVGISFDDHLALLRGAADAAIDAISPGGFFFVNFGEIAPQSHTKPLTGSSRQCLYPISKDYWQIFHVERNMDLYAMRMWYKPFNRLQQPFWTYHTSIPHHQEWEHLWTWRLPGGEGDACYDWDISSRAVWDTRTEATDDKPLTRHVAAFPVCLPERAIKAHSSSGATVWDPFLGSGTTMVVCEQLGRIGRGVEIEPKYVAVSLERLAGMGLEPRLAGTI